MSSYSEGLPMVLIEYLSKDYIYNSNVGAISDLLINHYPYVLPKSKKYRSKA